MRPIHSPRPDIGKDYLCSSEAHQSRVCRPHTYMNGGPDMPFFPLSSLVDSARSRFFTFAFEWGYRLTIRKGGGWAEPLIQEAAPRSGQRILEVSAEGCSICVALARQYPAVHVSAVPPAGLGRSAPEPLSNLELLNGNQCCIDCHAASFDKVICALALHPLTQNEKLALLKEMRRVLRHGGTLHLADFDQPQRPLEIHALRGTGYLFGAGTAKSHHDGTWLNLIKQAGFIGVRRVETFSEIVGRIAIVRARRG